MMKGSGTAPCPGSAHSQSGWTRRSRLAMPALRLQLSAPTSKRFGILKRRESLVGRRYRRHGGNNSSRFAAITSPSSVRFHHLKRDPLAGTPDLNRRIPHSFAILAQLPNLPQEPRSTQVLIRFCLRASILVIFAAFGSIGFSRSLAGVLWMSIILCAVIGTMKREPPFHAVLNHWDETGAFAALFALVSSFNHSVLV